MDINVTIKRAASDFPQQIAISSIFSSVPVMQDRTPRFGGLVLIAN